jgi:hypothetical protein
VTLGARLALGLHGFWVGHVEIDLGGPMWGNAVKLSDVADSVKRNTHSDLKLGCRKIDAGDHFGRRVLDLQTRIQLEEVEVIIGMTVKIWRNVRG